MRSRVMFKSALMLAAAFSILSIQGISQEIPTPTRAPVPTLEKHTALIREGISLHDRGDYDGAIRKYQEVLSENPDDITAIYEMGFSYFARRDYKQSLETAYKGVQYKSKSLPGFYTLIGNNLDQLNDHEKAIKAYKAGINLFPDYGQLHFNLAVAYISVNKFD